LFLGTGLQVDWTNLPLKPLFLPLMARLTFRLAGAEADHFQVHAGAPLTVPLAGRTRPVDVEVTQPGGEVLRLRVTDDKARTFTYTDTHEIGPYLIRLTDPRQPKQFAFAVNIDPEEADGTPLDRDELTRRFGRQPLVFCDDLNDVPGSMRKLREGASLWSLFLTAVLVGLMLEAFLANWLGGKKLSQGPKPISSRQPPATRSKTTEAAAVAFLDKLR
jgi:hypothetical protein